MNANLKKLWHEKESAVFNGLALPPHSVSVPVVKVKPKPKSKSKPKRRKK